MAKKRVRSKMPTINLEGDQEWIRTAFEKIAKERGQSQNDVLVDALKTFLGTVKVFPPKKSGLGEREMPAWITEPIPEPPDTSQKF